MQGAGRAGVELSAEARPKDWLAAFAEGRAFREWDQDGSRWGAEALAGLRMRW